MQSTNAPPECLLLARLLVSPILGDYGAVTQLILCHATVSVTDGSPGVGGINETESHCAIYCTMRASGQSPLMGRQNLNEDCVDTILLLLRVLALHGLC